VSAGISLYGAPENTLLQGGTCVIGNRAYLPYGGGGFVILAQREDVIADARGNIFVSDKTTAFLCFGFVKRNQSADVAARISSGFTLPAANQPLLLALPVLLFLVLALVVLLLALGEAHFKFHTPTRVMQVERY
jgi:hypothetical protein